MQQLGHAFYIVDLRRQEDVARVAKRDLEGGRVLGVPLAWFLRLLRGSAEARAKVGISPSGLHWDELDEDISIAGLLAGRGDMTRKRKAVA